jgi:dual-specificity kinase
MSTPTTATATLPHYNSHNPHRYPFSHHQSYQDSNTVAYRVSNPTLSSRLAYPPAGYFASSTAGTASNGVNSPSYPAQRLLHDESPSPALTEASYQAMPPVHAPTEEAQPARKRRRSKEPNWNEFYKNGLPKEIIVIDDSPEPEPAKSVTQAAPRTLPAPISITSGSTVGQFTTAAPAARHVAKKRKRDNEPTHYDPVYHNTYAGSHTNSQGTPAKSTSSDRTTSAVQTTAATSLESLPSTTSVTQDYYNVHAGQKRKRTTRGQIATEAKRREAEVNDGYLSYQPPPYPHKKASDIPVKAIHDVRTTPATMQHELTNSQISYSKGVKYDDDDGHYIVTPGGDLTDRCTCTPYLLSIKVYAAANRHLDRMEKLLGQGTFGKVVKAVDRRRGNECVAIKIIRSVQKYRDASKIELRVLRTLQANDERNRNRCIHLRDCFDYRGHICIVMDLLGQSVFDFLKGNNFVPFPNSQIQNFARQLFTSVACEYMALP